MRIVRPYIYFSLVCGALALVTLAVYWPVRLHAYVSYDDPEYVSANEIVQAGLTWAGAKWAFTTGWTSYWHPLTWLSHMLDAQLFGPGPTGPHLVNVALHLANTLLLFALLRRLTGAVWRSAWVAALFAVHPLHVESVAWISERKDVLSTCFFLVSLLAYTNYAQPANDRNLRSFRWYGGALGLFSLGLMSKPTVVTLPCVLLLLDYWPLGRGKAGPSLRAWTSLMVEKIPFFILSAASCVATFMIQNQNGAVQSLATVSLAGRGGNALVAYARYLAKTFWPADLAVFYPHPGHWPMGAILVSASVVAIVSVVALRSVRRFPFALVGWLWFLGILVPTIGLVQVGDQSMADRYTYVPAIGLFIVLAWAAGEVALRIPRVRGAICLVAGLLIVICASRTADQLRHWRDSESLFRQAIAVTTDNFVAHNNLGNALLEKGEVEEAMAHFRQALVIRSDYAPPHNNLGTVLLRLGRADEAIPHLKTALAIQPGFAEIHHNLGDAFRQTGRVDEAIVHYGKATALRPGLAVAWANLGMVMIESGRADEAIAPLQKALVIAPTDIQSHCNLGLALLQTGRAREAIPHLQAAVNSRPDSVAAHYPLALALFQQGLIAEAIRHFQRVVELQPDNAEVHNNLGWVLLQAGRVDEAIAGFETSLKLQPDSAPAHNNLALAFLHAGRARDAIARYQIFLELQPDTPQALADLAWLLATWPDPALRDRDRAMELAQRANLLSGGQDPTILRALAAAYAESGQFSAAIKTAEAALHLAETSTNAALGHALRLQLEFYQAGSAFREPSPKPDHTAPVRS